MNRATIITLTVVFACSLILLAWAEGKNDCNCSVQLTQQQVSSIQGGGNQRITVNATNSQRINLKESFPKWGGEILKIKAEHLLKNNKVCLELQPKSGDLISVNPIPTP